MSYLVTFSIHLLESVSTSTATLKSTLITNLPLAITITKPSFTQTLAIGDTCIRAADEMSMYCVPVGDFIMATILCSSF